MTETNLTILAVGFAFFAAYVIFALIAKYRLSQDKNRTPSEFQVQRCAGHSLRVKREELMDNLLFALLIGPVVPGMTAGLALIFLQALLPKDENLLIYGIPTLLFLLGAIVVGYRLFGKLLVIRDYSLGYKGELDVAYHLDPPQVQRLPRLSRPARLRERQAVQH